MSTRKRIVLLLVLTVTLLLSWALFTDWQKSRFITEDNAAEMSSRLDATKRAEKVVLSIENASKTNKVEFLKKSEDNCFTGKNKKAGYKSRYCELKAIAYVYVSSKDLDKLIDELRKNFSNSLQISYGAETRDTTAERTIKWSYSPKFTTFELKVQSSSKNDLRGKMPELQSDQDYIIDIYYYDKYSEITKPLAIFEYF